MITVRKSEERRHIENKDQKTWMTFDWENKADPLQNGFGVLKILNEEVISPGRGFILHTHRDMVIVTYVQEGVVIYNSPLEKAALLESGHFHLIDAAPQSKQFAFDASPLDDAHVFQSGFVPGTGVSNPEGEKKFFTLAERRGILRLIASPDGKEASLRIRQDVQMYSTLLHKGNHMVHELHPGRKAWLHVVKGHIALGEIQLQAGDGAGFTGESFVSFTAMEPSEILLFDLGG